MPHVLVPTVYKRARFLCVVSFFSLVRLCYRPSLLDWRRRRRWTAPNKPESTLAVRRWGNASSTLHIWNPPPPPLPPGEFARLGMALDEACVITDKTGAGGSLTHGDCSPRPQIGVLDSRRLQQEATRLVTR